MDFDDLDDAAGARLQEVLDQLPPQACSCRSAYEGEGPLRLGILSTANIVDAGIIGPAWKSLGAVSIVGIASRDPAAARSFKDARSAVLAGATVFDDYQSLLDCEEVDCVYLPLPNGLHYEWVTKALIAGKHVLCEKPVASNSEEARAMVALAEEKNLVLMEGMHWFYHPVRARLLDLLRCGALGSVQEIRFRFVLKMGLGRRVLEQKGTIDPDKFGGKMWILKTELAGGLTMTLGTYCLSVLRVLGQGEPLVGQVTAVCLADIPELDCEMRAEMQMPGSEIRGVLEWSGMGPEPFHNELVIKGSEANLSTAGLMTNVGPLRLTITDHEGSELFAEDVDSLRGEERLTTYDLQLLAFVDCVHDVRTGKRAATSFPNTGEDLVQQMLAIDRVYCAAGLTPRSGPAGVHSKVSR